MALRKIGQILIDLGFLDEDQLDMLLSEQERNPGQLLGKIGLEMGLLIGRAAGSGAGRTAEHAGRHVGRDEAARRTCSRWCPETMAQLYRVIPIQFKDNVLTVATCDPQNLAIQDEMRTFLGFEIRTRRGHRTRDSKGARQVLCGGHREPRKRRQYAQRGRRRWRRRPSRCPATARSSWSSKVVDSAPVRKLLNIVLLTAIKEHASDIHFEPFEDEFRIRVKADGVLYELVPPPRHLAFAITTRIKVMANLDIAERRLPQDGRIELSVGGHPVDLRVSVMPTMFGESVVMRVLDRSVVSLDLEQGRHERGDAQGISQA